MLEHQYLIVDERRVAKHQSMIELLSGVRSCGCPSIGRQGHQLATLRVEGWDAQLKLIVEHLVRHGHWVVGGHK